MSTGPFVADLSAALSVLRIRGADRFSWLQGQVTNDVHAAGTLHAFRLDAQGRIEAEVRGIRVDDAILLVTDASRADALAKSLDRRIVMEDVEVSIDRSIAVIGVYGAEVDPSLLDAPSLASRRFGENGREWIVAASDVGSRISELVESTHGERANLEALDRIRIRNGYPRLGVDFDAALPQETGLTRSTVSFSKGCYVGQEPVVMLEHRGKPPRRAAVLEGPLTLTAPFDLTRGDRTTVGHCASYCEGLGIALLKRADANEGASLHAGDAILRVVRIIDEGPT